MKYALVLLGFWAMGVHAESGVGTRKAQASINFKIIIPAVIKIEVPVNGSPILATNMPRERVLKHTEDVFPRTMVASTAPVAIEPPVRYITGALP